MKLHLPEEWAKHIREHGSREYPSEACGILLGSFEDDIQVQRCVAMDNARKAETRYEFVIPPEELFRVMKEGRKNGLDICGFYHSHPDHPAEPSKKDQAWGGETWPGVAHIIQAVSKGQPEATKAYVFSMEQGSFAEISIEVL